MSDISSAKEERIWYIKTVIKFAFVLVAVIVLLLVLAGRTSYWQGWVFGLFYILGILVNTIFLYCDTGQVGK
jgi:hypothetical protein